MVLENNRTHGGMIMPSSSVRQAKTMSAIAHGWRPKGSAKDIPVRVAKEFHAADKGKKYGKGHDKHNPGHHRSHSENPKAHYEADSHHHKSEAPGHHSPSHYTPGHHSVHNPTTHNPHGQTHEEHRGKHAKHHEHHHHEGHHGHEEFRAPHHSPAGIANNDGFTGKTERQFTGHGDGRHGGKGNLEHHAKQPHGRKGKEMVGFAETRHHEGHDSYHGEQEEHWGHEAESGGGTTRGIGTNRPHGHGRVVAYTRHHNADHDHAHSKLVGQAGMGHHKQPHGHSDGGPGDTGVADHHAGHTLKHEHDTHNAVTHEPLTAHVFKNPMGGESHGYGHESYQRHGFLRHSGHKGAHRIGHRGK
jgi:hypothetical protein